MSFVTLSDIFTCNPASNLSDVPNDENEAVLIPRNVIGLL